MRLKATLVCEFDELTPRAKEKAREWMRSIEAEDFDADATIEDATHVAGILGIEFDSRQILTRSGKARAETNVFWSGFYSQGDGASFTGHFDFAKFDASRLDDYAPKDETLKKIAAAISEACAKTKYRAAIVRSSSYYNHSRTMYLDIPEEFEANTAAENQLLEAIRSFADWIYSQLQTEYEYRQSNDAVDETIRANEYEFFTDGRRA